MTEMQTTKGKSAADKNARRRSRRSVAKPTLSRPKRSPAQAQRTIRQPEKVRTKRDQLAALLVRDEGATIDQMREVTGWLPHTVRAALTGLKKLGYAIDSDKVDGLRTYRAVAPE
jgi:hypothetical protein